MSQASQVARIPRGEPRVAAPLRLRAEEIHVLAAAADPRVLVQLRGLGYRSVREHGSIATLASRLRPSMTGCAVLPMRDDFEQAQAAALLSVLRRRPGCALVLLVARADPQAWLRASGLTPHCYPAELPPDTLARLIASAMEAAGARAERASELPDTVTIKLWESVEVDGREVYLGVAERNFLFSLARRPGLVIPKREAIETGPGTRLRASTCRRRLGQRLGPALASLLIPQARFEPYRMREPEDVAALTRGIRDVPVKLRVLGRAGVMMVSGG